MTIRDHSKVELLKFNDQTVDFYYFLYVYAIPSGFMVLLIKYVLNIFFIFFFVLFFFFFFFFFLIISLNVTPDIIVYSFFTLEERIF
jgi:hypothetical protein